MNNIYICLLRGINVGRHHRILMTDLRKLFEDLHFDNVQTYIQSGNIVFSAIEKDITVLQNQITEKIKERFIFDVPSVVIPLFKLKSILETNPFNTNNNESLYFTFCLEPVHSDNKNALHNNSGNEAFHISESVIYLYLPNGYGKAKLNTSYIENKLRQTATTRNLKTMNQLLITAEKNSR